MKKTDLTRHAFQNMKARKLRSLLTVISIMIGIAAVSSLISFGNGLTSYVDELSKQNNYTTKRCNVRFPSRF